MGGNNRKIVIFGLYYNLISAHVGSQHVKGGYLQAFFHDSYSAGGISLRVQVDQKHLIAQYAKGSGNIYCRGGFSHSALLVCKRNDFSHLFFVIPFILFAKAGKNGSGGINLFPIIITYNSAKCNIYQKESKHFFLLMFHVKHQKIT